MKLNNKIHGVSTIWANFPGFSLLFDSPGHPFRELNGLELLACDISNDPSLKFYRALNEGLGALDPPSLFWNYSLCLLPTTSYHVTVYDGGNMGNAKSAVAEYRAELESLLADITGTWDDSGPLVRPASQSTLVTERRKISFKFGKLSVWSPDVLVVQLQAADEPSIRALQQLETERATLSNTYRSGFGFGAGPGYCPHLSLGYFATNEGAERAILDESDWDAELRRKTEGLEICFESIHAYGFTNMATFFRTAED